MVVGWEILFLLRDAGFIEIHKCKGVEMLHKCNKSTDMKVRAKDIPKTCINECEKCHKDFEAEITIGETCNNCFEEMNKKIEERIKKERGNGNTNPEWMIRFETMIEEYGKQI